MANLIEYIQSQIYENSTEDISGSIMQQVLTRMASDEGVVNVHTISGQTPFADYNNAQAARDAVPAGFKKLGLIITYKLSSGWYIDEFIGSATSGWSTASNWKCLGPISVSQNAETGKTTITIGSQSYDVATQPVSVSQNTLTIGGEDKGELAGQLVQNPEWVQVVTDSQDKILYGVKTDGKFYFGDGCPPQVQEYVTAQLGSFDASDYADIKTFLGNLIDGDTLATLLNAKVDKVIGKSLIDAEFANSQSVIENPEWIQVTTDSEGKILEGITSEGKKKVEIPIENNATEIYAIQDTEGRTEIKTDAKGKILSYRDSEGVKYECGGVESPSINSKNVNSENVNTEHLQFNTQKGESEFKKSMSIYDTNLFTAFDNLLCIGDSLTVSAVPINMQVNPPTYRNAYVPYPKVVSRLSGNIDFQILATAGFTAKDVWDTYGNDIVAKQNAIAVVFLGSNGGLTDTLDTDVVGDNPDNWADNNIGCYCRIINKLQELDYKVVVLRVFRSSIIPIITTNSAINHVAERFECVCIDAPYTLEPSYHKAIISGEDYLHSNDLGYAWFAMKLIENLGNSTSEQISLLISNN